MEQRELLKLLRDVPPRQALDAIEDEAMNSGLSFDTEAEGEKFARVVWERALDAIIYA